MKFNSQTRFLIYNALFSFVPMRRQVLFVCFEGRQFGDNPRRIMEYLHEQVPEIRIYWAIKSEDLIEKLPSYVKPVIFNTLKYAWVKNRSKMIISNGAGTMLMNLSGRKKIYRRFIKKKKQFEIATWHGTPLKHIGADIPESPFNMNTIVSSADVLIASSDYERKIFERAFCNKISVQTLGYARNDVLFQKNNKSEIKRKLGIPENKNVILYAPTYRDDNLYTSGISQLNEMNFDSLYSALSEKFGGDWVLVYRFHNLVCRTEEMQRYTSSESIINGNLSDDMADYLSITDVLITDYSGSLFDVLGTKIKCFLYTPDEKEYICKRGLYLNMDELPYSRASSYKDLLNNIICFDERQYIKAVSSFEEKINSKNDGLAAERIFDLLIYPNL